MTIEEERLTLKAEKRKLAKEREALEAEKAAFRDMLRRPAEEKQVMYLTADEVQDQLSRIALLSQRVKREMWAVSIRLDQNRRYGAEYTV